MPAAGSGDGFTRVNTGVLRDVAAQGRQDVSSFRAIIDQMEQALNASESFWEGDAAELYRNVFRREISEMRQVYEAFAAYPSDLVGYADRYDKTETDAVAIANNIEQAVWADV
jgi:WXG100 family type VII secretion target